MRRGKGKVQRGPTRNEAVVGVAWYQAEQWARLREIAVDRDALESSYVAWEAVAQDTMLQLAQGGIVAQKVIVDVEDLLAWCVGHGRAVDALARSQYVAEKLRELHETEG